MFILIAMLGLQGILLKTLDISFYSVFMTHTTCIIRGFIKGQAPGKLTGGERDLAINLPGCFHLLFLLSLTRNTKNAQLKNPTDLLHENLMKLMSVSYDVNKSYEFFYELCHLTNIFTSKFVPTSLNINWLGMCTCISLQEDSIPNPISQSTNMHLATSHKNSIELIAVYHSAEIHMHACPCMSKPWTLLTLQGSTLRQIQSHLRLKVIPQK